MKQCARCKEHKPLEDFDKNGKYLRGNCRPCQLEYHKEYNRSHSTDIYFMNVLRKYGLSKEGYYELLDKQESKCAICKRDRKLNVDHDHEFGYHRGLLCGSCNNGMNLIDNFLEEALAYKEEWAV